MNSGCSFNRHLSKRDTNKIISPISIKFFAIYILLLTFYFDHNFCTVTMDKGIGCVYKHIQINWLYSSHNAKKCTTTFCYLHTPDYHRKPIPCQKILFKSNPYHYLNAETFRQCCQYLWQPTVFFGSYENNHSVTNPGANNKVSYQVHLGFNSLQYSIKYTTYVTS